MPICFLKQCDMKKSRIVFLIISLTLLIVTSCSKDSDLFRSSDSRKSYIMLRLAEMGEGNSGDFESRYGITGSTSSWNAYFENAVDTTDTMGLFPNGGYQIPFVVPLAPGTTSNSVVVTASGWTTKKMTTYAIYLPFNYYNRNYDSIVWDLRKIPLQKSNTDHVKAVQMILVASDTCQSTSGPTGDTLKANLFMRGALLQIRAKMTSVPQSTKYVRMMLSSSQPDEFTVLGTINLFKNTPVSATDYARYGPDQELTSKIKTDHVTINLDRIEKNASNNYVVGYFPVVPTDFTGKTLTVYLWDEDGNIYSGSIVRSTSSPVRRHTFLNYNFNTMNLYTGTLPKLNPWEEEDLCPTCNPVAF